MKTSLKLYHRWWKAWRTLPVFNWVKAAALYRAGRFAEAARYYASGLESHPHHAAADGARLDLAYCYFKVGKLAEARDLLSLLLEANPESRHAYLRLARVQQWMGQLVESAWTLRKAYHLSGQDAELVGYLLNAVVDGGAPTELLREALSAVNRLPVAEREHPRIMLGRAKLRLLGENEDDGIAQLEQLATTGKPTREAVLAWAEFLIRHGRLAEGRMHLRRVMSVSPDHPTAHLLFAESYLQGSPFYNPEFAIQLATTGCQRVGWSNPRALHLLAEAYREFGDKTSALLFASRAKELGSRILGEYRDSEKLDSLIEKLSGGTVA